MGEWELNNLLSKEIANEIDRNILKILLSMSETRIDKLEYILKEISKIDEKS